MYDISIRTVMLGKLTVARLSAVSCCIVILTGCLIVFDMAVMGQSTNQVTERKETVIRLIDTADSLIKIQLVESARPYVQQAQELKDQYQMELTYSQLLTLAQSWADVFEPMRGSAIIRTLLLTIPEGDRVKRCVLNDKLARYVNQTGQFQEAETMFRKNLATAELNGLDSCKALAYWGLSISLGAMQQEDEQIRAAKSMAWIARRNNFTELEAIAYYMAGYGYYQAKKSDLAIENLEKSVRISELAGLPLRTLAAHMLIAWVYYTEGHKTQAISWYRASLELARSSRQKTNHCNILGRIGTIYRENGRPDSAIWYYQQAISTGKDARDYFNLAWIYYDQFELYNTQGNYKDALASHILHKQFSDSLEAQQFRRGLNRIRQSYAAEQELKDKELLQMKLRQQTIVSRSIVAGTLLISITLTIIVVQIRSSGKRRISEMRSRIDEITQRNLRQQMNPHFIFNTLNSIQFYLYQQDKLAVNEYLNKFSLLIRKTLDNSLQPTIALKEEIDMVRLYLELESLRFKERLSWEITVDDEIDLIEMKVPAMLIQPLVENAITHGLRHKSGEGYVRVCLSLCDEHILCKVEDNGIGRDAAREMNSTSHPGHPSLSSDITETRLGLINDLYGKNLKILYTDLSTADGEPSGTRVTITLPFNL